jgi:hypothetical protein
LQDANYNVTGLVRACDAKVIRQFRYEPYGQFTAVEGLDTSDPEYPMVGITNSQLFESFQGFQGRWHDAETITDNPAGNSAGTSVDLTGGYVFGVRDYDPPYGRPRQRDPNGQGLVLTNVLASNAQTKSAFAFVDPAMQYDDSMSPYGLFLNNPNTNRDPSGLSANFDWMAETEDIESDLIGHKLYALGAINEGARWASIGLQTTVDIAGSLLGVDMYRTPFIFGQGRDIGFWDAVDIFLAVAPFGKVVKASAKVSKALKYTRGSSRAVDIAGKAAEHLFKILPYRQARKLTRGWNHKIEAHHLLEVRHAERWGINPGDIPAVVLPYNLHREITAELWRKLPRGKRFMTSAEKKEVWRVYKEVYTDFGFGEWLSHIDKYFP